MARPCLAMLSLSRFVLCRTLPLEQLSLFCGNLATCIAAGLDVPKSLHACQRFSPEPVLKRALQRAAERTATGTALADALMDCRNVFPAFFLPVLQCGEQSGRIEHALRYLERHCRLLAGPAKVMRKTWLAPLCIMLVASAICVLAYAFLAPWQVTLGYVARTLFFYGGVGLILGCALYLPQARPLVDSLKLATPVIGAAERELTINRFFHAMSLLYATGGRRVEQMIRLAAASAENCVLHGDFLRAATAIESGATIGQAFSAMSTLPLDYKTTIVTGDEAGKLEEALDTISRLSGQSAEHRLAAFQQVFFRVVALAAISSMVMTLYSLILMNG